MPVRRPGFPANFDVPPTHRKSPSEFRVGNSAKQGKRWRDEPAPGPLKGHFPIIRCLPMQRQQFNTPTARMSIASVSIFAFCAVADYKTTPHAGGRARQSGA
jgi:hypothetical protein